MWIQIFSFDKLTAFVVLWSQIFGFIELKKFVILWSQIFGELTTFIILCSKILGFDELTMFVILWSQIFGCTKWRMALVHEVKRKLLNFEGYFCESLCPILKASYQPYWFKDKIVCLPPKRPVRG